MRMWIKALIPSLGLLSAAVAAAATPVTRCPVMFFDLGQTLVDTKTNDFNPMFLLVPGPGFADSQLFETSKDYTDLLTQRFGLSLGLLVDVPGTWGTVRDKALEPIRNPFAAKFLRTKEFLLGK